MKIKLIGIGGASRNILNAVIDSGFDATDAVYMDTDTNATFASKSGNFLQLGEAIFHGLGTGRDPQGGLVAAQFTEEAIIAVLKDCDFAILVAGLGGGVGSGATPYIAELAESYIEADVMAVVTIPSKIESERSKKNATVALNNLIELLGEKVYLINIPDIQIGKMFDVADQVALTKIKTLIQKNKQN